MKLEEDLKAYRYVREQIDLTVTPEGFVTLPAWQSALFVKEYEHQRTNALSWFALFVVMIFWILFEIFIFT